MKTDREEQFLEMFDTDAYGDPYRWLTIRELLPILDEHWPTHPTTAYMPGDGLVVLDWT